LFISETLIDEVSKGDEDAAKDRLAVLTGLPTLRIDEPTTELAERLVKALQLPDSALLDAYHIAVSAVNGIDFLLTWNCTHINNAHMRHAVNNLCLLAGYEPPIMCTPEELRKVPS